LLIANGLLDEFIKTVRKKERDCASSFKSNRETNYQNHQGAIETDIKHRNIINTCISPFLNGGALQSIGYNFERTSPLCELKPKPSNFDILISKKCDRSVFAIFIECKSSIDDYAKVFSDFEKQMDAVKNNIDYIKERYLGIDSEIRFITNYVLAVPTNVAHRIAINPYLSENTNLIVWGVSTFDGNRTIQLYESPKNSAKLKNKHHDQKLNEALKDTIECIPNEFDLFPQMHSAIELFSLRRAVSKHNRVGIVDKNYLLDDILKKDLFYLPDEMIIEMRDRIWKHGIEIGLLTPTKNSNLCKYTSKMGEGCDEAIQKKWIDHELKKELFICKEIALKSTIEEYTLKCKIRPIDYYDQED
jgi:hypothetical protein